MGILDRSSRVRMRGLAGRRWLLARLFVCLAFCHSAYAAEPAAAKNVLVLYSFTDPSVVISVHALESELRASAPWPINFNIEYLESTRFDDPNYERSVAATLQYTYSGEKLDLVIVDAYPALEFAVRHRDEILPGVPIVFLDVDSSRIAGKKIWPGVTGVSSTTDVGSTIDLVLHLHPATENFAVITNQSEFERYWLAAVHSELLRRRDKVKEIDLVGPPTGQLLERVAALPPHTVVLFQLAPQESSQPVVGVYDTLVAVSQGLPTYCIFPVLCLDRGGIGGAEFDYEQDILLAAKVASRVLSGERPDSIPVVHDTSKRIRVDWRQLQRWHIPESALPPGSEVLYKPPTLWQRDRNYIMAGLGIIVTQLVLIIGLLRQRARKRKAEAVLRESEKRFRVMADTAPSMIWMCDQQGKIIYLNERRVAFTGPDPGASYGDTWTAYVHPDDLEGVLDTISQALKTREPLSNEYRLRRHDGVYRWMFDVASPRVNGDGSFAGFIGSATDITDQKLAQEALERVSGQLIEAQEKERGRIARELHDDICQRLALLSMELEQANRNGASPTTKQTLEEIRHHCSEIAGDVQSLSHQLHSSKLDYLGIVAAVRGFCKEFAKQHDVRIDFTDHDVPARLPRDISLCLFRVAQEALHNAVKYSGMSQFTVEMRGTGEKVQVVVSDAGAGFEVEDVKKNRGLGLVSMQERVHLVHGRFHVESRPGAGTKIVAVVPVSSGSTMSAPDERADKAASVGTA